MNVQCMITVETNETNSNMLLNVYEFAPFLESTDFCLTVDERKGVCSGSGQYKNFATMHEDKKQWTIKMRKRSSHKLQVRFWMMIKG